MGFRNAVGGSRALSVEATGILNTSQEYGINTEVPKLATEFLKHADKADYRNEELAALIKVFRARLAAS